MEQDIKSKLKNWLKNKHNFIFLGILILAVAIRLYYLYQTAQQPLWWDEADYMAYAKNIAGYHVDWIVTSKHNSLYPFLAAFFFKLGSSEFLAKLFLQIIPSIIIVFLAYHLANEMYGDKKYGLIASFLAAVFWAIIVNSTRFHVDIPALFFGMLSLYVFWIGYEKKKRIFWRINPQWAIPLTVFLVIITYAIRRGYFLFALFILAYMLCTRKFSELIKDKYNWVGLAVGIALFLFAENVIFISHIGEVSEGYYHKEDPINFLPLKVFSEFFSPSQNAIAGILLYLFWLGFIIISINLAISFGHIKNSAKAKANLFNFLAIVLTLAMFIFVLRAQGTLGEARWYLPLAFSSIICIASSSIFIFDSLKKHSRNIAVLAIIILLGIGGYYQLKMSNLSIKSGKDSFQGIREASLMLKEVSDENDIIIALSAPQVAYYAERTVKRPRDLLGINNTNNVPFDPVLEKIKSDNSIGYIIVSFSEPNHPDWMRNSDTDIQQSKTWKIPFMNTQVNFATNKQDIKQSITYGTVTFNLIAIKNEVFVYEIISG